MFDYCSVARPSNQPNAMNMLRVLTLNAVLCGMSCFGAAFPISLCTMSHLFGASVCKTIRPTTVAIVCPVCL